MNDRLRRKATSHGQEDRQTRRDVWRSTCGQMAVFYWHSSIHGPPPCRGGQRANSMLVVMRRRLDTRRTLTLGDAPLAISVRNGCCNMPLRVVIMHSQKRERDGTSRETNRSSRRPDGIRVEVCDPRNFLLAISFELVILRLGVVLVSSREVFRREVCQLGRQWRK